MRGFSAINEALLVEICERFAADGRPVKIVRWLREEHGIDISPEDVHKRILPWAKRLGLFWVFAPPCDRLARLIAEKYDQDPERIHVVDTRKENARRDVTRAAAALTVNLIREVQQLKAARQGDERDRVHVGLGGGRTVRQTSEALAKLLRLEPLLPDLAFHAISSGFSVDDPLSAPVTFLPRFQELPGDVRLFGLFAPAVVATSRYPEVKRNPGVRESFRQAKSIDIVLTSLARAEDPHGALAEFARFSGRQGFDEAALKRAGWLGDIQYIPYSARGPIDVDARVRAVTLFEYKDLRALARSPGKHVVLVASPCGVCKEFKTDAVRPLLERKELRVWTHVLIDRSTAQELVR